MLDLVEMMTHMRDIVSDQRTQCDRFSGTSGPGFEAAIPSSIARVRASLDRPDGSVRKPVIQACTKARTATIVTAEAHRVPIPDVQSR